MPLARYQFSVVDDAGNIVPAAAIEVRLESAAAPLASLFSDRDGLVTLGNPTAADAEGFVFFHVIGGAYKITATSGSFQRIWRYVGIGLMSENDLDVLLGSNRITARVATTANVTIATALNNGDVIDGVTLATSDLVLVKSQTDPTQNGVYVVGVTPARHVSFDTWAEHVGALISVTSGTANAGTLWIINVPNTGILGTTALPVSQIKFQSTGATGASGSPLPRVATTASSATPTPNADTTDQYQLTAQAAAAAFAAPTGTPAAGQKLLIRVKDNGTARALTWNAVYRAGADVSLPTTTVSSKTMYIGFIYNLTDTKWDLVGVTGNI